MAASGREARREAKGGFVRSKTKPNISAREVSGGFGFRVWGFGFNLSVEFCGLGV